MLAVTALLIVASCSKSKVEPEEEVESCLVSQATIFGELDHFTYDHNGYVVKWTRYGELETYTCTNSTITTKSGATYPLTQHNKHG